LKALPFISFAPLQLGARRSFVLPMPLPPEAANGIVVGATYHRIGKPVRRNTLSYK